jgi:short-subunit dehydrogenase
MDANFWGTVYPTLAVLPSMRLRGSGRIANVTSIGGRISAPHLLPYSAAKFAATGFSEGLRAELARDGVTVTTIVPWFMHTGSHLRALFKPPRDEEFRWFALGASLPLVSKGPEGAAREIVAAIKRGDAERSIGILSVAAWRFHGLFPAVTANLLGIANRFLPRAPVAVGPGLPSVPSVPGEVAERELDSRVLEAATVLGRRAADRLNERTTPET